MKIFFVLSRFVLGLSF
jgi:hypothetical protein